MILFINKKEIIKILIKAIFLTKYYYNNIFFNLNKI